MVNVVYDQLNWKTTSYSGILKLWQCRNWQNKSILVVWFRNFIKTN